MTRSAFRAEPTANSHGSHHTEDRVMEWVKQALKECEAAEALAKKSSTYATAKAEEHKDYAEEMHRRWSRLCALKAQLSDLLTGDNSAGVPL